MKPALKSSFPKAFDLSREVPDYGDGPMCCGSSESKSDKKKKGKVRIIHPSAYMYNAPEGLARALKELSASEDGATYALVKIKPTRTSETTILDKKSGETEEKCDCEFDILEIHLPEADSEEATPTDIEGALDQAAKEVGMVDDGDDD